MPMSRSSLDLKIVSLPKHHKENKKIVNVWTEVVSGISKLCYLKEIFYQLGHQQTIRLEVFYYCKRPTYGAKQIHRFLEYKLALGIFSTFNWKKMHANKMQEHDSS